MTNVLPNAEKIYSTDRLEILADRAGSPYFSPSTMRFFRSRVGETVYGNRYFVTSEQYVDMHGNREARRYTIREFRFFLNTEGRVRVDIETVGEFQQFADSKSANRAAKRLADFMGDDADAFPTPEAGLIAAGIV